ncbi:MAG TPA: hypothetical protein VN977_05210, partial [Candidatus Binatia bacterium]|nr:hypothetical protein [Candidatus Binatia bacterium]
MAGALAPAESRGADAVLSCPGTAVVGDQFTAEVTINVAAPCTANADCGVGWACTNNKCTTALGSYSIQLSYDPTVVSVPGSCSTTTTMACTVDTDCPSGETCTPLISGGTSTGFQGTPIAHTVCPTANSCVTRIAAFQASLTG